MDGSGTFNRQLRSQFSIKEDSNLEMDQDILSPDVESDAKKNNNFGMVKRRI